MSKVEPNGNGGNGNGDNSAFGMNVNTPGWARPYLALAASLLNLINSRGALTLVLLFGVAFYAYKVALPEAAKRTEALDKQCELTAQVAKAVDNVVAQEKAQTEWQTKWEAQVSERHRQLIAQQQAMQDQHKQMQDQHDQMMQSQNKIMGSLQERKKDGT